MDNSKQKSAYVTAKNTKKVSHFLPRVGTPMLQDVVKRSYSSPQIRLSTSQGPFREISHSVIKNMVEIRHAYSQQFNQLTQLRQNYNMSSLLQKCQQSSFLSNIFQSAHKEPKQILKYQPSHRALRSRNVVKAVPKTSGITRFILPAMFNQPNFRKTAHKSRSISLSGTAIILGAWMLLNYKSKFTPQKPDNASGKALASHSDNIPVNKSMSPIQKVNELLQTKKQYVENETYKSLIETGPVNIIWGLFWQNVFSTTQIHDALLKLLIGGIKNKEFVDKSSDFGLTWIGHCVQQPKVVDEALVLSEKTFVQDQDVIKSSLEFCSWYVEQPRVISEVCKIIEHVTCHRTDTNDIVCWQIAQGAGNTLYHPLFNLAVLQSGSDWMSSNEVKDGMMNVTKAEFKDRFSLGAYGLIFAGNERLEDVGQKFQQSINTVYTQKTIQHQ